MKSGLEDGRVSLILLSIILTFSLSSLSAGWGDSVFNLLVSSGCFNESSASLPCCTVETKRSQLVTGHISLCISISDSILSKSRRRTTWLNQSVYMRSHLRVNDVLFHQQVTLWSCYMKKSFAHSVLSKRDQKWIQSVFVRAYGMFFYLNRILSWAGLHIQTCFTSSELFFLDTSLVSFFPPFLLFFFTSSSTIIFISSSCLFCSSSFAICSSFLVQKHS